MIITLLLFGTFFVVAAAIRTAVVWRDIRLARSTGRWPYPMSRSLRRQRRRRNEAETDDDEEEEDEVKIRTLVVLGSGGHTTEMLSLIAPLQHRTEREEKEATTPSPCEPRCCRFEFMYCKASTDTTSAQRLPIGISSSSSSLSSCPCPALYNIPRSREVGQSYLTSIVTTAFSFVWSLGMVLRVRPNLVLCNGPGTCLPVCGTVMVLRLLGVLRNCPIVFVESVCRVRTLSLTGRILYPWADLFAVHWPELHERYPETVVLESFVVHRQRSSCNEPASD